MDGRRRARPPHVGRAGRRLTVAGDRATETAYLAAGCFWGVEHLFKQAPGVVDTEVGYAGGASAGPTYESVCSGETGHAEAVRIEFDPAATSFEEIVRWFFRLHDPTTLNRQHNDVGTQYRSAILFVGDRQGEAARRLVAEEDASGRWDRPVATTVEPLGRFWPAEPEHQDYLDRHPGGYNCHVLRA